MSKTPLQKLEHSLRPISLMDRIRARFQEAPSRSSYCDIYDKWLSDRLDCLVSVESCGRYDLVLNTELGTVSLWVSNYPYSYGGPALGRHNAFIHSKPSWRTVLRIREIQLRYRDNIIKSYKEDLLRTK